MTTIIKEKIQLEYDPSLYPPVSELMIALQDPGKESTDKNDKKVLKYHKIQKFSKIVFQSLLDRKIKGLDLNHSRGIKKITSLVVMLRHTVDRSFVFEPLQKYCKTKDNTMFIIENDSDHAGYQILLDH